MYTLSSIAIWIASHWFMWLYVLVVLVLITIAAGFGYALTSPQANRADPDPFEDAPLLYVVTILAAVCISLLLITAITRATMYFVA